MRVQTFSEYGYQILSLAVIVAPRIVVFSLIVRVNGRVGMKGVFMLGMIWDARGCVDEKDFWGPCIEELWWNISCYPDASEMRNGNAR